MKHRHGWQVLDGRPCYPRALLDLKGGPHAELASLSDYRLVLDQSMTEEPMLSRLFRAGRWQPGFAVRAFPT